VTPGTADAGIKVVANTSVIEGPDELIYDIDFDVPDSPENTSDRVIRPFAITAPTIAGQTIDLATVTKLPHRSELGEFSL
jgi:hypothetical protein